MQIRTRLSIQFAFFVAIILLLFSLTLYYFSWRYQQEEFQHFMRNRALATAKRFSQDVKEIDTKLLKVFDRTARTIYPGENTEVFDTNYRRVYNKSDVDSFSYAPSFFKTIVKEGETKAYHADTLLVGVYYVGKFDKLISISRGIDSLGVSKLRNLKMILIGCFLISMTATVLLALFFSKQALAPISHVVSQVERIKASNLRLKVDEGNGKDEIAQLASEFNRMLERLADSFEMQRSFISNASHELRTPLTSIMGQLEVSLMNPGLHPETRELLLSVLEDMKNLNKLSNGLLTLIQASLEMTDLNLSVLRIDELVGQARAELAKTNPGYTINVSLKEYPEEESSLLVNGNEVLLRIALINILDNACKYSPDHTVNVSIEFEEGKVKLTFEDHGIGISPKDLKRVFETFYRGINTRGKKGHGIGLTLTKRIIEMHKGSILIDSVLEEGTLVTITLPKMIA
jgi:signal transduction histidine kinase